MKPFRYALLLVLIYAATAGAYIWLSGAVAARMAVNVDQLAQIERFKGLAFVATTAGLLLVASWLMFRSVGQATEERERMRQAVMIAQSRVLAGELAAAVAHDFNNALMVIQSAVTAAQAHPAPGRDQADLREAGEAAEYARQLSLQLARTARGQRVLRFERRDLTPVTKSVVHSLARLPRLHQHSIDVALAPESVAEVDVILFEQILSNLVLNAADAAGGTGAVRVELATEPAHIRLEVHDNGPGIPPERRQNVFTAFETTKPGGLGLGLLSVRVGVELQGGTLSIESSPLGGAAFIVRLPRTRAEPRSDDRAG